MKKIGMVNRASPMLEHIHHLDIVTLAQWERNSIRWKEKSVKTQGGALEFQTGKGRVDILRWLAVHNKRRPERNSFFIEG